MEKHKIKHENEDLKNQISDLKRKFDVVNQSLTKFIKLSQNQDDHIKILESEYDSLKMIIMKEIDKSIKYKHLIKLINIKKKLLKISN